MEEVPIYFFEKIEPHAKSVAIGRVTEPLPPEGFLGHPYRLDFRLIHGHWPLRTVLVQGLSAIVNHAIVCFHGPRGKKKNERKVCCSVIGEWKS